MEELKISLAAARVNARMTQEDVSKALKVSKSTIVNWERGSATPSFATVSALCNLYGIPINNIFLPKAGTLSEG